MTVQRLNLPLSGLGCAAGEGHSIERILAGQPGVREVYLNPVTEIAHVDYDPAVATPLGLRRVLQEAGYRVEPAGPPRSALRRPAGPPRLHIRRLTLAGGVWLLTLYAVCVTALFLAGSPPTAGMFRFWEIFLVGFDPARASRVLLGFVEAFLYGAAGAWLFGWVYLLLPLGDSSSGRGSRMTTSARAWWAFLGFGGVAAAFLHARRSCRAWLGRRRCRRWSCSLCW